MSSSSLKFKDIDKDNNTNSGSSEAGKPADDPVNIVDVNNQHVSLVLYLPNGSFSKDPTMISEFDLCGDRLMQVLVSKVILTVGHESGKRVSL